CGRFQQLITRVPEQDIDALPLQDLRDSGSSFHSSNLRIFIEATETMPANRLLGSHYRAKAYSLHRKRCRSGRIRAGIALLEDAAVIAMQKQGPHQSQQCAEAHVIGGSDR